MRLLLALLLTAFFTQMLSAQDGEIKPIYTSWDLLDRGEASGLDRQLCFAYIRGFSDGNRWLLRDMPVAVGVGVPHSVCVPNSESISTAADFFVARFRWRRDELSDLSPFRALSMALSGRYPCD